MQKYEISLRTRDGQKVDNLVISGRDQAEAENKVKQIYRYCEIVSCEPKNGSPKPSDTASVEDILSLIAK